MKRYIFFLLLLIVSLTLLFNVERLDINGENNLNLQTFIYLLIPIAVICILILPIFSENRVSWTIGAWIAIYIVLKIAINGSIEFLTGIQFYLTMTEILFVIGISTISQKLAKEFQQFNRAVDRLTILMAGQQINDIESAKNEIHREMTRSRQYQRPMSVIVMESSLHATDIDNVELFEEIQKKTANVYLRAKMADSLKKELRLMDIVLFDNEKNQLVIVCPEVNKDGTKPVISRLSTQLNTIGIEAQFSSATFPEEGLTFAGLIDTARQKTNRLSSSM